MHNYQTWAWIQPTNKLTKQQKMCLTNLKKTDKLWPWEGLELHGKKKITPSTPKLWIYYQDLAMCQEDTTFAFNEICAKFSSGILLVYSCNIWVTHFLYKIILFNQNNAYFAILLNLKYSLYFGASLTECQRKSDGMLKSGKLKNRTFLFRTKADKLWHTCIQRQCVKESKLSFTNHLSCKHTAFSEACLHYSLPHLALLSLLYNFCLLSKKDSMGENKGTEMNHGSNRSVNTNDHNLLQGWQSRDTWECTWTDA